jgi:Pretoxin HINT domain
MGGLASAASGAFGEAEGAGGFARGCSFSADTTVAMADGSSEPISKLRPGDLVEAYDPATGKTGPHRVTAVTVNRDPATEHLVLDTGAIETTPNHPFYTADRGWVEAGVLKLGEKIRTVTGTDATVVSYTLDAHPASMWDITVAGAHSFFVGSGAVLVHNCARPASLEANPDAVGPHVTWRTDAAGNMTSYAEWASQTNPLNPNPWQLVKRVDLTGGPHIVNGISIPTPHVHIPGLPVRPALPWEIP